jgi:hypothetical protein
MRDKVVTVDRGVIVRDKVLVTAALLVAVVVQFNLNTNFVAFCLTVLYRFLGWL